MEKPAANMLKTIEFLNKSDKNFFFFEIIFFLLSVLLFKDFVTDHLDLFIPK